MAFSDIVSYWAGGDLIYKRKSTGGGVFRIDADKPTAIARGVATITAKLNVATGLAAVTSAVALAKTKNVASLKAGLYLSVDNAATAGMITLYRFNRTYNAAGSPGTVNWIAIGTPALT
jgi:hypothetical protein